MRTICESQAHFILTISVLHASFMHLLIYWIRTVCSMCIACIHNVYSMHIVCVQYAYCMYTNCLQYVYRIHAVDASYYRPNTHNHVPMLHIWYALILHSSMNIMTISAYSHYAYLLATWACLHASTHIVHIYMPFSLYVDTWICTRRSANIHTWICIYIYIHISLCIRMYV